MRRIFAALITLALGASVAARAHDFWVEPSTFRPEAGSVVRFALRVGEHFKGDPVPRDDGRILRFALLDARGEAPLLGANGADPAGVARVGTDGIAIVGFMGKPTSITVPPEKFESYLREEGLEHVSDFRAKARQSASPGKEIYSRCAKAILRVGGKASGGFDRPLGCAFELIPETLPGSRDDGATTFRALSHGRPAKGIKVVALRKDTSERVEARTGADGRAKLAVKGAGIWLVKAVSMSRALEDSQAEWESIWASVTFELASTPVAPETTSVVVADIRLR